MYTAEDLCFLQNFDREYSDHGLRVSNRQIRIICLLLIFCPYVTSYLYWDWHYFLVPFTNWTLVVTTLTLMLTIWGAENEQYFSQKAIDPKAEARDARSYYLSIRVQSAHHVLYSLSMVMNVVVMSVYWTLLHSDQVRIHQNDPGVGHGRVIHMKLAHSVPGSVCFINAFITNTKLKPSFWRVISGVTLIYGTFIYLFWKITGRIQYSFLDFNQGYSAFWHILAINLGATLFYFVAASVDNTLKPNLHLRVRRPGDTDDLQWSTMLAMDSTDSDEEAT